MAVVIIARNKSTNHPMDSSHKVAVATIAGMILGILCLFGMIIAYQVFLPKKRKPSPQLRALAPPPPKALPLLTRLSTYCTTLFTRIFSRLRVPSDDGGPSSRGRRTLRSLHLVTSERRRQRDEMRRKFAGSLRLNLHLPKFSSTSPPSSSPHNYKRYYSDSYDMEESKHLLRPDSAVISPWSPIEDCLSPHRTVEFRPYPLSGTEPGTPPSPLPPAYLHSTPIRPGFQQMTNVGHNSPTVDFPSAPTSPTTVDEEMDVVDSKLIIEEIEEVLKYTRDWTGGDEQVGSFVVGESEDDPDYETVSIQTVSIHNDV